MKRLLYYRVPEKAQGETLFNLCEDTYLKEASFFLLPDKQMSIVNILSLPPVPKKRLREMIRFKIDTIYPGNFEEICYDYISYRKEKEWQVILYILKKKLTASVCGKRECHGIVLPLQLVPGKTMQSLSSLVILYPDMKEVWKIEDGVPVELIRSDREEILPPILPSERNRLIISQSVQKPPGISAGAVISTEDRAIHITFSKALRSSGLKEVYFPTLRKKPKDILTPFLAVTAFLLSLVLLVHTISKYTDIKQETARVLSYTKTVKRNEKSVKARLKTISILESSLMEKEKNAPVNLYDILLRMRKTVDHGTVISSFTFTGKDISFSCSSKNALETLKRIKREFGTVSISRITPFRDGTEHYTIKLESGK